MTMYWTQLLPGTNGNHDYKLRSYGALLASNKGLLAAAMGARTIRPERCALMVSMAMIETHHFSSSERDAKKDGRTDGGANATIFNLSEDLLRQVGYTGNIHLLDALSSLSIVVGYIDKGINTWGVTRFLNFVRGGRDAFNDGVSYGAADYRCAVATALKLIDMYPALMSDDRRVEMDVKYV